MTAISRRLDNRKLQLELDTQRLFLLTTHYRSPDLQGQQKSHVCPQLLVNVIHDTLSRACRRISHKQSLVKESSFAWPSTGASPEAYAEELARRGTALAFEVRTLDLPEC